MRSRARQMGARRREQGNGLLFAPPQTGAGKRGAGAGVRETAPPGPHLAPAAGGGAGSARAEEGRRGGGGQAEGRVCSEGNGREETWSKDLRQRGRHERVTETERPKPKLKCAQRRRGRHGGRTTRRTAAGTARGPPAALAGRREHGRALAGRRAAGDRWLAGSWHRLGPPAPPGLAELARLRGQAGPAVCPGLSASREGVLAAGRAGEGPAPEEGRRLADRKRSCGGPARCQGWAWGVRKELAEARGEGSGEGARAGNRESPK